MLACWKALQCLEGVQQWHRAVAGSEAVKAGLDVEATYLTVHPQAASNEVGIMAKVCQSCAGRSRRLCYWNPRRDG
jgi:hypothetical protein